MVQTHDQARRTRRRAALGLLLAGAMLGAACSASSEVASGPGADGAAETADNATDPAALASALGGIATSTTAAGDGPTADASGAQNCKQFTYQEDAQAMLAGDLADPYHLDEDKNGVACDGLPKKPAQTLPPQTSPPTTTPPTTAATAPPQTIPPPTTGPTPTPTTPTADEQKVVNFINTKIGKMLTPEVTLFNGARAGAKAPPGPVVYTFYAYASATGGGSIDSLLDYLGAQVGQFGSCTHIGVGILGDPAGQKINVICGKY